MFDDKSIMKYETTLPEDFTGVFYFTNWTDEEFTGAWGGKKYVYPAQATSPMIIPEHSPLEVQYIRKKFAKDLAEKAFYNSTSYNKLMTQERNPDGSPRLNGLHSAGTYSIDQLAPFIQRCLEPLPISKALVTEDKKAPVEESLSRNEDGELNTTAFGVKDNVNLREKALKA
jgi:hypothetical protein